MWIKAQDEQMYAGDQFLTYVTEVANGLTHKVIGVTRNHERIVLLKYTSFEQKNFLKVALKRIENGIANGQRLVDLTGICKLDYTEDEIEHKERARSVACPA